jgi:hypothetical protein
MKQKTVIAECNPIFQKEGQKGWPTGVDDSQLVLRLGYYYSETSDLLERSDFSSKLKEKVKGWSLSDLVCSALWFTFEKKQLSTYSWSIFFTFLMHCSCTDSVLFFLEFSFIDKILLREDIINGVFFTLENTSFFHVDINCVEVAQFKIVDLVNLKNLVQGSTSKKSMFLRKLFFLFGNMIRTGHTVIQVFYRLKSKVNSNLNLKKEIVVSYLLAVRNNL